MARFALIAASVLGFFLTAAITNLIRPALHVPEHTEQASSASDATPETTPETSRSDTPPQEPHASPVGLCAVGGISYIVGTLAAVGVAWSGLCIRMPEAIFGTDSIGTGARPTTMLLVALGSAFAFAAIGFADDLVRLRRRQVVGLHAPTRVALEMLAALVTVLYLRASGCLPSAVVLPVVGYRDLGMGGYLAWMLFLVALAESMRVTDTSDGLCAGMAFVAQLALMSAAARLNYFAVSLLPAALAGGLMAFLLWNFPPAKLWNGSTGSMFLAGALGGISLAIGWPMLGVLLGLPFLAQGAMVLAQRVFARATGKPLFAAAPLHRWLQKRGWSDVKVCYAFCALEVCVMMLTLLFVRMS
jgi:phospho-N-acetylmuramoyl-pentapeptide-transferase